MLEEPLGELLLDLLNRLSLFASGLRRKPFAFLLVAFRLLPFAFRLLPHLLVLLGPMFGLLPPADVTHCAQPGDHQDRDGDESASQPAAVLVHLLVDLLELGGEPFHFQAQAADLLVELLGVATGL